MRNQRSDESGSLQSLQRVGSAGPCTDPVEVAHFPPKRQEASRIQVGKWPLSEIGTQQLMLAELALHSTVAQATAHGLECRAVLCCACSVLGYTWVQATNAYQLGLLHWPCPWLASLCPFVIYQHQQFPVSSQESLGSMALQTLLQQGGQETPRPQKIVCSPGGHGGPVGWPLPLPQSPSIYLF